MRPAQRNYVNIAIFNRMPQKLYVQSLGVELATHFSTIPKSNQPQNSQLQTTMQ